MYKIITINEEELRNYNGKIIQVIESTRDFVCCGYDYLNVPKNKLVWFITCLVEE